MKEPYWTLSDRQSGRAGSNLIDAFHEKHYTLKEVAEKLRVSTKTALKLVKKQPGVLKFCLGKKKARGTYKIPESAFRRIYNRMVV